MTTGSILAEGALGAADTTEGDVAYAPPAPPPRAPRALTPELRRKLGLPERALAPYPWPHAIIAVFVFGVPLAFAGHPELSALLAVVALALLPVWRRFEHRVATAGEALYRDGEETLARVLYVEPAGPGRRDHVVRVAYLVGGAQVEARVVGAPLARQGLKPGEEVLVVHDRDEPARCLVVARATAEVRARVDAPVPLEVDEHDHACCGAGGCGGGACDGEGGCGGGACDGKGGCGGGGCGGGCSH